MNKKLWINPVVKVLLAGLFLVMLAGCGKTEQMEVSTQTNSAAESSAEEKDSGDTSEVEAAETVINYEALGTGKHKVITTTESNVAEAEEACSYDADGYCTLCGDYQYLTPQEYLDCYLRDNSEVIAQSAETMGLAMSVLLENDCIVYRYEFPEGYIPAETRSLVAETLELSFLELGDTLLTDRQDEIDRAPQIRDLIVEVYADGEKLVGFSVEENRNRFGQDSAGAEESE